jgi:soluble lytic murein transglycosylase-like protein
MMKSNHLSLLFFSSVAVCGALACVLFAPRSAVAGTVYRCTGSNGQLAFTNRPEGHSGCKKVADYADAPPAKAAPASATARRADYRSETAPAAEHGQAASAEASETATPPAPSGKDVEIHRGAVYKIVRANGVTEYTNMRPSRGGYQVLFTYISTCYACNIHSTVNWMSTALNLGAYRAEVAAAAAEFGVDPSLLRAVIHAESAFNPNAISDKGAEGLMQLIPGTASDMGVNNPFDVSQNIRGGAQYLSGLLKQFKGDERMATAAYNAGPQNVLKYNGVPPFDETRVYVDRVATLRQRYHAAE